MPGQSATQPAARPVLSPAQFQTRVSERERREAFRREHRIVVREEIPGSFDRSNSAANEQLPPGLLRRRIIMVAVPCGLILGIIAAKLIRRGAKTS